MNRLFLIILAVMFACTAKEEKTIITGTIDNPATERFEITYPKDLITGREEKHIIILDENNSFKLEIAIRKPIMAQLKIRGEDPVSLYIKPGDDLQISADGDDLKASLSFAGKNADNNKFLFEYQNKILIDNEYLPQQVVNKIRTLEPAEFVEYWEEMLKTKKEPFYNIDENKSISEDLVSYLKTEVAYTSYSYRLFYPMFIIAKDKWEELPEGYFDFLDNARSKMDDKKLVSESYRNYIEHYLDYYKLQNPEEAPEGLSAVEENIYFAEKLLTGKTLQHTKAGLIYKEFYLGDFDKAAELYKSFLDEEKPCRNMDNILTEVYESFKRTLPGNPAPDFELTDINGEVVSLSDFRGKVVYLDFWASWCPPCMREVPYAKELKKRFEDEEDLVFLYISIDEDPDAWRRTVKDREIKGVHLNVFGRYHEVPSSYNVRWIPTYYIIDRDGAIFKNNAKRPSFEGIDDDLKAALELV